MELLCLAAPSNREYLIYNNNVNQGRKALLKDCAHKQKKPNHRIESGEKKRCGAGKSIGPYLLCVGLKHLL